MSREITDPIERIVGDALDRAQIEYYHESEGAELDFLLSASGVLIECKQFPTPRTSEQIAKHESVIVIQGRRAAQWFADHIAPMNKPAERRA